jgi:hypothetical protein
MANVSHNGDFIIWEVPVTNPSPFEITNAVVTITQSQGTTYQSHVASKGTYNPSTKIWTIGSVSGNKTETLKITVSVSNILNAPFTNTSVVSFDGVDPNNLNNTNVQTVASTTCPPTGGASATESGCLCVDLEKTTTKCTSGVTEWRLISNSVVNSSTYTWDKLTGKGNFTPINPTLPITFKYDLYCVKGVDEFQVSCAVTHTITKQLENINIFDHKISTIKGSSLQPSEITTLLGQYTNLTNADVVGYCWNLIRNGLGVVTSGLPLDCNEKQDTRQFLLLSTVAINTGSTALPSDISPQLPTSNYTPQEGDTIAIMHPDGAFSWFKYTTSWVRVTYYIPFINSLTTTGTGAATIVNGVLNIPTPTSSGISLTTTGTGVATLVGSTLNIPTPAPNVVNSLTTTGSGAATLSGGVLNIPTPTPGSSISLTTTGSGAATLVGSVLNIPNESVSSLTVLGSGAATLSGGVLNIPTPPNQFITSITTTGVGTPSVASGVLNIPYRLPKKYVSTAGAGLPGTLPASPSGLPAGVQIPASDAPVGSKFIATISYHSSGTATVNNYYLRNVDTNTDLANMRVSTRNASDKIITEVVAFDGIGATIEFTTMFIGGTVANDTTISNIVIVVERIDQL